MALPVPFLVPPAKLRSHLGTPAAKLQLVKPRHPCHRPPAGPIHPLSLFSNRVWGEGYSVQAMRQECWGCPRETRPSSCPQ